MPSVADTWMTEGYKKGFAQGFALGFAIGSGRGQVLAYKKIIIQILQMRFGNVSSEIEDRINSMSDVTALESLFNTAKNCASLEDFTLF